MKLSCLYWIIVLLLLQACTVNDAKVPRNQHVHVFTDYYCRQDSLLYRKFFNEEGIRVHVSILPADSLLKLVEKRKYDSGVDLILVSDYGKISRFSSHNMFLPLESEVLERNIDPVYRSRYGKWFALSKSALVFAYNRHVLKKDTISTYYELVSEKWKEKIAFQNVKDPTLAAFNRNIRLLMKERADHFLYRFYSQRQPPFEGDDFTVLEKIRYGKAQLGMIKLSSLARYHWPESYGYDPTRLDVSVIFPNQRKRGCYFTISGGGVYRYARNPLQAKKLMEFLSGKRAQYLFAEGRFEYPIMKDVQAHYVLESYGKIRGRFYKNKPAQGKNG